jgi:hypothetical protein
MVPDAATKRRLVATLPTGPGMAIVQELRQLLPQAFIALAFVTKNDRAFKQRFLQPLGQIAPKVESGSSKNEKIAVIAPGRFSRCAHHRCPLNGRRLAAAPMG